jgi:selenocysteine lyase/cysteine desulfurase
LEASDFLHFAAHSHHYWPDVTREATLEAWDHAATTTDLKWKKIMSEVFPKTQRHIAKLINFSRPEDIALAPNTHDLVFRLLSCFFEQDKVKVLSTDSEFYSFARQIKRLKEWDKFQVEQVKVDDSFIENFVSKLESNKYDVVFLSQVFFNSGKVISNEDMDKIIQAAGNATICLDGYHSFAAVPVDISKWEDKIFFTSGSYKYAQGGEGVCFMTLPKDCQLRPLTTGWFAEFSDLSEAQPDEVTYAPNGMRFWGATIEPISYYRFNATWDQFEEDKVSLEQMDDYVKELQRYFLHKLKQNRPKLLENSQLTNEDINTQGHFLGLVFENSKQTKEAYEGLIEKKIITDFRDKLLRIGFGVYQDKNDIDEFFNRLI